MIQINPPHLFGIRCYVNDVSQQASAVRPKRLLLFGRDASNFSSGLEQGTPGNGGNFRTSDHFYTLNKAAEWLLRHRSFVFPVRSLRGEFERDLQERSGILALSAPNGICKLQILLAKRETDPVSGHHLESMT
jgi:hypothetical protein